MSAEDVLTADLSSEVVRAELAEASLESALTAAISEERQHHVDGDASVTTAFKAADSIEKARAEAAELSLQSNIDVEKGRIDAILDGSDVDLDQFAEVVSFVNSIDLENDNALLSSVVAINETIDTEVSRAESAEASLDTKYESITYDLNSDLSSEIVNRTANVDAEKSRATAAEAVLTADLSSEVVRAELAEASLESALTAAISEERQHHVDGDASVTTAFKAADSIEKARAEAAELSLQSNIDVEKGRIDAILDGSDVDLDQFAEVVSFVNSIDLENDNALLSSVVAINETIDTEVSRAESAEASLDTKYESITYDLNSDLSSEIVNRTANVDAEKSRATAAEAVLTADLSSEVVRAELAEVSLESAIADEQKARKNADASIEVRVNDIISNTDLTAIDSFTEVIENINTNMQTTYNDVDRYVVSNRPSMIGFDSFPDGKVTKFTAKVVKGTEIVFLNGVMQLVDVDYTIATNESDFRDRESGISSDVTFTFVPAVTDKLNIYGVATGLSMTDAPTL